MDLEIWVLLMAHAQTRRSSGRNAESLALTPEGIAQVDNEACRQIRSCLSEAGRSLGRVFSMHGNRSSSLTTERVMKRLGLWNGRDAGSAARVKLSRSGRPYTAFWAQRDAPWTQDRAEFFRRFAQPESADDPDRWKTSAPLVVATPAFVDLLNGRLFARKDGTRLAATPGRVFLWRLPARQLH